MKVYKGTSILMIAIVLMTILIMPFPQIAPGSLQPCADENIPLPRSGKELSKMG
jgi:hypothetical protein